MKTQKTLLLILLCLFFTAVPVYAQTPENTADSAETLTAAVSALSETGGTIHLTKDIILEADSGAGAFEPDSPITLALGGNTLTIKSDWSFKNMTITGQNTLLILRNNAGLRLDHTILSAAQDNSTAIAVTRDSVLSAESSIIEVDGANACGIHAPGSSSLELTSTAIKVSGAGSTAIRTAGSLDAFFSEIKAEGTDASAVSGASEVFLNTTAVSPEIPGAVIAETTQEQRNDGYHYTELGAAAGLPDSLIFRITDAAAGSTRLTPSLPVCWDTDGADVRKAGIYPLGYRFYADAFIPDGAAALLKKQKQQLVVIDPEKPFIYYDAPVISDAEGYSLLLRFHQPIQSFGTPTLWVEKDSSGVWNAWPAEKLTAADSKHYSVSGLEAGHSYVFQLEPGNGSVTGLSNALRVTLDREGRPTVTQSDTNYTPGETTVQVSSSASLTEKEEKAVPTAQKSAESTKAVTGEELKSESVLYLQEMGNALKTASSYLNGTSPVSKNVNTGIAGSLTGHVRDVLPVAAALTLVLLCAAMMLLMRKND